MPKSSLCSAPLFPMRYSIHRQYCFLRCACVVAALTISGTAQSAGITYETRALTGTDGPLGPGLGAGVSFSDFAGPVLNSAGQTAFKGVLTGAGVTGANHRGIWSEGGSGPVLVVRGGDQAPGAAIGVSFSDFFDLRLNGAGQMAFTGFLTGVGGGPPQTNRASGPRVAGQVCRWSHAQATKPQARLSE